MRSRATLVSARPTIAILLAWALTLSVAGCSRGVPGVETDSSMSDGGSAGTVIFDMAHGEVFGADDASELGQSAAVAAIRDAGFTVEIARERLGRGDLDGVSGLIIAGPMVAFGEEEVEVIEEFVRGGGVAMLTVHVPYAIHALPERFGLTIPDGVIQSPRSLSSSDAGIFEADEVASHQLTDGVDSIVVLSSWAVQAATGRAGVVVATGGDSWLSAHTTEPSAPVIGSFGVVAVSEVGAGTFIAIGDDAVFANAALDEADNRQLLENVIRLMGRETRPI